MPLLTGRCLCEGIAYEITDDLPQYGELPEEGLR